MTIAPTYLLLVPVGILIAVAYTSTGISGANFWFPVFTLGLGLEPRLAFWLALVSMLFGSSSGLLRHARQATVDYGLAGRLLLASVPAAVVGALLSPAATRSAVGPRVRGVRTDLRHGPPQDGSGGQGGGRPRDRVGGGETRGRLPLWAGSAPG